MTKPKPVSVRIPREVKDWLKARAEANDRSLHGEILAVLKAVRQADDGQPKTA